MQSPTNEIEQRRDRILQAARAVFETHRSIDVGLRQIAAQAGYTTGAIYKLFTGKEDIYAALLASSLTDLSHAVAAAAARDVDLSKSIRESAYAFVKYYKKNEFEFYLGMYLFERGGRKGLGRARDTELNNLLNATLIVFETGFSRLQIQHESRLEPEQQAHALFAALIGVLSLHFSGRDKSIGTQSDVILDTLLSTLI